MFKIDSLSVDVAPFTPFGLFSILFIGCAGCTIMQFDELTPCIISAQKTVDARLFFFLISNESESEVPGESNALLQAYNFDEHIMDGLIREYAVL